MAAFCLLAAVALAAGCGLNLARSQPLPWLYASPEARLAGVVRSVAVQPKAAEGARLREIGLEEFQRFVAERNGIVLDARSATFYRLGHVPGALNLSRESFEGDYAYLRPVLTSKKDQPIAVYCSGVDCEDSVLVGKALLQLGFEKVLVYPEGWEQWTAVGLPRDPPAKADL